MPGRPHRGVLSGPVLLFDGDCGFCRRWVARLRRLDRHGAITSLPAAERHTLPGLPAFDPAELQRALQLVLPNGTVHTGARALPVMLGLLPGWRHLAWIFRVPGVQPLADRAYAWVAARRHRLGCGPRGCELG